MKVAIVINDGQSGSVNAGTDVTTSSGHTASFNAARCTVNAMIASGIHVIHIYSNRSSFAGQNELASFASTNLKGGNSATSYGPTTNGPNQNFGNILPLHFNFTSFSELMTPKILQPVAAALRGLTSPGRASASACVVSGDPHFTTFDGLHFDYQGVGDYWLFRSVRAADPLSVQYRAGPCATSASCVQGAVITDGTDRVEVMIADRIGNTKNAYLAVNGTKIPLTDFVSQDAIGVPFPNVNITVKLLGSSSYAVTVLYAVGHTLTVQKNLLTFQPAPHLYGRGVGMCGVPNNCPLDDLTDSCGQIGAVNTSDPSAASRFGDSWSVRGGESLFSTAPAAGVQLSEVANNIICPFSPATWLSKPQFNRWPFLPMIYRDASSAQSTTAATSIYPKPDITQPNVAPNNIGLVSLKPMQVLSTFQIPAQCARMRGALQQDCIYDSTVYSDAIDSSIELLWQACTQYCATGNLFTNLVAPADCAAAQICSLAVETPNLHANYRTGSSLPDVSFGNPNSPDTFFQPTLGLAGRYLLEVAESDLCGVSRKVQAVDINCATETPQVVLAFPGFVSKATTQPTTTDPLVTAITTLNPDRYAGYPYLTIQASVFPSSTLLGHSWKLISRPLLNAFNESIPEPLLEGASSSRLRFTPTATGTYVFEYAVWTGCTVSRARALVFAACSVAPPVASIQPEFNSVTNADSTVLYPFTTPTNVAISWLGAYTTATGVSGVGDSTPLQQSNIDAVKGRWSNVRLTTFNTFDADTPNKALKYRWRLRNLAATRTNAADNIVLLTAEDPTPTSDTFSSGTNGFNAYGAGSCSTSDGTDIFTTSRITNLARSSGLNERGIRTRTYVYEFGIKPVWNLTPTVSKQITPAATTVNAPTYELIQPTQVFGASSNLPATSVAPARWLFNAYRRRVSTTGSTTETTETRNFFGITQALCRVTLTQDDSLGGSTATLKFEEVGDLPKSFAPINYCQAALYTVELEVQDECQVSTDTVTLEPTCDGYTQAIVQADQIVYWNNATQSFPSTQVDGTQSFDEMYDSPTGSSYGSSYSQPSNRALTYEWTALSMTPLVSGQVSRFTHAAGFQQTSLTTSTMTFTPDLPGTYKAGLRVSNRCVVSEQAVATVKFSCYGANPCTANIALDVKTSIAGAAFVAYTAPITVRPVAAFNTLQSVRFDVSSSTHTWANSWTHTPIYRYRTRVIEAPATSVWATSNSTSYPQISSWTATTSYQTFLPDAAGTYRILVEITDSCGCAIVSREVTILAQCLTTTGDLLSLTFANYDGISLPSTFPVTENPSTLTPKVVLKPILVATAFTGPRTWTINGPGMTEQRSTDQRFVFTPPVVGQFVVALVGRDGCQELRNSTTLTVVAADAAVVPNCDALPRSIAVAKIITAGGAAVDAESNSPVTTTFRYWSLPKVTLAAFGGFATSDRTYADTNVEWTVTQAPANSIYNVGETYSQSQSVSSVTASANFDGYFYDPNTNTNRYSTVTTSANTTMWTFNKADVIIPLLSQRSSLPVSTAVWGTSQSYYTAGNNFGPEQTAPESYTGLHSQVVTTLDRPGTYRFKLRYTNKTDVTRCPTEDEVYFTATCNTAPVVASTTLTPAVPKIDSLRPLRVAVAVSATDVDAGDSDRLTYAWEFKSAPYLSMPFNTLASSRDLTTKNDVSITHPKAALNRFPAIFNQHQKSIHFLALTPGNYTLQVSVSDGCNLVTKLVEIIIGCDGRNQYGSVNNPAVTSSQTTVGPANTNAFTINDAVNGAVPISSNGQTATDVSRILWTQWRIVGFTPSFSSNSTLQSSRASRGLPELFEESRSTQYVTRTEDSGLSDSAKIGLGVGLGVGLGGILIGGLIFFMVKRSAATVADAPKTSA